jgi:hypothetical protein
MTSRSPADAAGARRNWIALLYFYVAALVGLGFFITGITTGLFAAKELAFPELGLSTSNYEGTLRRDPQGVIIATDAEREQARQRELADRRREGGSDLVDGVILIAVGLPTLVWHLRRARRLGAPGEPPPVPRTEPSPSVATPGTDATA